MPRYAIKIEYDGTDFAGWQRQDDVPSIQEAIEGALFLLAEETVIIHAAGRTDKGVHAYGQVAHFDMAKDMDPINILKGINYFLYKKTCPDGQIVIQDCKRVDKEFHARFSAIKRHYRYHIINVAHPIAIDRKRLWHVASNLDIEMMSKAANDFVGEHDFTSFRAVRCQSKSPIKTLDQFDIRRQDNHIIFEVNARSFLHHQVRNMVGTLVEIGNKKRNADDVKKLLALKDRTLSGVTAPACGLYLIKIEYQETLFT